MAKRMRFTALWLTTVTFCVWCITRARAVVAATVVNVKENTSPGVLVADISLPQGLTAWMYELNDDGSIYTQLVNAHFEVDVSSGVVRTRASLDFEDVTKRTWRVVVVARKEGRNAGSVPQMLFVHVLDENDNPPRFSKREYHGFVKENEGIGTVVSGLSGAFVTDSDSPSNGVDLLTFRVLSGNNRTSFVVRGRKGAGGDLIFLEVITTKRLDREEQKEYDLVIETSDSWHNDSCHVTVVVFDVNDNSPVFASSGYQVTIPSDLRPGTSVAHLSATDKDDGLYGEIYYSLSVAGNSNFSINPYTGIVSTTRSLIGASGQSVLTIEARDRQTGKQQISSTTLLTITVKEANYYSPQINVRFSLPAAVGTGSVHESAPVGMSVSTVTVVDLDKGVNGITTLNISSGNEDQTFKVADNGNGQFVLELNRRLDREKVAQYALQLMASDIGEPMKITSAIIMIQVLDDNDMTPQFEKSHYDVNVDESVLIGSQVAFMTATDRDIGINAKVLYSIKSGNNPKWFSIDSVTGQIRTVSLLDAKENGLFQLVIMAQDQGAVRLSSSTVVTVTVSDNNNHSPMFDWSSYTAKVRESTEIGSEVMNLTATDRDVSNNGIVSYSIIYNNPQRPDPFVINSTTGVVFTTSALDYELSSWYSLTVRASDYGTPYLQHSDVTLTVHVVNENDNAPRFSPSSYSPLVASTAPAGTTVTRLKAIDDDLDSLTFTLANGDQTKFNVTHDGYVIVLISLGTRLPEYVLKVLVSDGRYNATARIIVTIYDSALRIPVFQTSSGYSFSVSEVASIGHIVGRVQAFSTDNLSVTYNIADGNQDGVFGVNQSGDIALLRRMDYEKQKVYSLAVTAVDKSGSVQRTGVVSVSIQVINVNDELPVFYEDLKKEVIISQNATKGSHVLTVRASDADNDPLTYSLHGSSEVVSHFTMKDSYSGIIVTKKTFLDNDPPLLFPEVNIEVTDGLHSASYSFAVVIEDSNNQYPQFSSSIVEFNVSEDATVGHVIGSIVAQDHDLEYNSVLRYLITAGNDGSKFAIDSITGVLSVQSALDYETVRLYNVTVTVGDVGFPRLTSTSHVGIHIVNVNDLPPEFVDAFYIVSISESTPVSQTILTVTAIDPDDCSVTYEIASDVRGRFSVDQTSGVVRVAKSLDRESTPEFQFYIRAFDGAPSLSSLVRVRVHLIDENDEPPKFLLSQYDITVREDLPVGSVAVTLYAQDSDEGSNSIVKYQMRTGDVTTWMVDDVTSSIILLRSLKKNEQFRVEVIATDVVSPYQIAATTVMINVLETNRNYNPPLFPGFISMGVIHENAAISTPVMTVTAIDEDMDENSDIIYTVRGGSGVGLFTIDKQSGEVTVLSQVDYEKSSYYTLLIHAHDQGLIPLTVETDIVINVIDINDNNPVADDDVIKGLVFPCAGSGGFVAAVYASDVDNGYGGDVSYAITSGNSLRRFSIDSITGIVTSLSGIDSDGLSQYNLLITLSDNGTLHLSSTAVVTVNVVDCSDQNLQFVGLPYVSQVQENYNSLYLFQVVAQYGNSADSIMFMLHDTFHGLFSINSSTGVISCQPLDYETEQQYNLTVTAKSRSNTASTNVAVFVINERDKPVFTNLPTNIYVQESFAINRVIMSVTAVDPDGLPHTNILYSIVSADEDILSVFIINSVSGDISQNGSVDYERRNQYSVYVEAKYNNSHLFSWSYLTIIVLDNDDNLPVFDQSPFYYVMVPSLSIANMTLITIHAVDYDTGTNAAIEYAVAPSNQSHFSINHLTGTLQMRQPLAGQTATVTVIARNPTNIARQTKVDIILSVQMPSSFIPVFATPKVISLSLRESLGINTVVAMATATSSGSATVQYEIAGGNVDGAWSVDKVKGSLAIAKKLVYERVSKYNLVIRAIVQQKLPQTDEKTFVINILPVNDHKPWFTQPNPCTVFIEEDQPTGLFVTRATASDLDAGRDGHIRYSLAGSSVFSIDTVTGVVTTTSSLDYETRSSYVLYVQAHDFGLPALMADVELKLIVNVVDLLDDQPVFHQVYSAMIPENSPVGTTLVAVSAMDINKKPTYYSLTSLNMAELFCINPLSGDIIIASRLDRENMNYFELSITGSNGLTESQTVVSVHLQDVNDNAPRFNQSLYSFLMKENRTYGQQPFFLSAQDSDYGANGTITYSMVTSSSANLQVTSNGSVTVRIPLDREKSSFEHFIAVASDGGVPSLYGYAKVEVSVTDVNDHTPIFTSASYEASVREDAALGTTVACVVATDLDVGENGKVRYRIISGNSGNIFEINSLLGAVMLKANLNSENKATYHLIVEAADGGQPQKMSTTILFVIILDAASALPQFSRSVYQASVNEESMVGAFVTHVVVTSIPSVVYSLVETTDARKFSINSNTGVVTTAALLDRETQDSFKLTVNATDEYSQCNSVEILITVNDLNDNAPKFQQELYATFVPDDAPLGLEVLVVFAVDQDVGSNGNVSYRYVKSSSCFSLDQRTGNFTTNCLLTGMGGETFHLVITADDHGYPSFSALQQAIIYVTVTEPHYPKFNKALYNVSIVVPVDVDVVTVSATDVDTNETLTYSIVSGDTQNHFSIDSMTGRIIVRQHVGISSFYKLKVAASDRVHVNYTVVLVYVSTLFEFSQSHYSISVSEGAPIGTVILSFNLLTAMRDVTFSLSTPFTEFMMRQNASLFIDDHLDRETRCFYHFFVIAKSSDLSRIASAEVNVTVADVNDNAPQFVGQQPFMAYFREGQPAGTTIYQMFGHDDDEGVNAEISFQLVGVYPGLPFTLLSGGQIVASQNLDSGTYVSYQIEIKCFDSGRPSLSSTVRVSLSKLAHSVVVPLFEHSSYILSVSEDSPVGSTVSFIRAVARVGSKVTYSIKAGGDKFAVDLNGALIVSKTLDFESRQQHLLIVQGADEMHTTDVTIKIDVLDVNDNSPRFLLGDNLFFSWCQQSFILSAGKQIQ
ncbi:protocadherin Fat 4-like [Corticium candelabrum]|uniref:protocadherin Fat 4-like n=1 Tax=Corticium candelabrum TaxID=121492 RepID=UPI002E26E44D|nr:protocadherin Fat 4-like [Corticium candelabrum]